METAITKKENYSVALTGQNVFNLPSVRNVGKSEVFQAVSTGIARAFADTGFSLPERDNLNYLTNELTDNIISKYPSLRHQEIAQAFSKGVRKEFGDYFGLSVVTFENFVSGYIDSAKRVEQAKSAALQLNKLMNTKDIPSDEQVFNMALFNAETALKSFKSSGSIGLLGGVVYDFLSGLKLIEYSNEEKQEIFNQAKEELYQEAQEKKAANLDRIKRIELGRFIDNLNGGGELLLIKARAKRICVEEFFRSMEMEDTDVIELIKSTKQKEPVTS